ncbi:MAG: hypothetical protein JSS79_08850 [Bacteroidetes bacterium]|nr:hypothetical protein [Bacteroidota bacterium]
MAFVQFIPFFYFQQTRLNNLRALVFHAAYEWMPAALIVLYASGWEWQPLTLVALHYLGFIALYEVGYLANDQLAHRSESERKRSQKFSFAQLIIFVLIRIATFGAVAVFTKNSANYHWWAWYMLLIGCFAAHNILKEALLKSITFLSLAFIRFFSPVIFLIDAALFQALALPVVLNYVMYRLLTYMDSKNLFVQIDRKSDTFRIGYYLLMMLLSAALSVATNSYLPLAVNAYFLAVNSITFLPKLLSK